MSRELLDIASMFPKPSGTLRLLGRHCPDYKEADYSVRFAISRVAKTCKLHSKFSNVHSKLLPQFLHLIPTRLILKDLLYQLLLINYFKSAPLQKLKVNKRRQAENELTLPHSIPWNMVHNLHNLWDFIVR
jgi:hypothetical protein